MIKKDGNMWELWQILCKKYNFTSTFVGLLWNNNNNNNNNALYTFNHLISVNMDLKLGLHTGVKYGMTHTKWHTPNKNSFICARNEDKAGFDECTIPNSEMGNRILGSFAIDEKEIFKIMHENTHTHTHTHTHT